MRLFLSILLVLLGTVVHPDAAGAAGDAVIRDLKNTRIIKSQEQPHNILNEACVACHPKEKFDFWLLIFKGKPPVVSVEGAGEKERPGGQAPIAGTAAARKNRYNSHESLGCNFCHFGTPTAA
ncbi:MAG: hypothetical protein ACM3NF_11340, partial [Gemmatimonadota bacterium]